MSNDIKAIGKKNPNLPFHPAVRAGVYEVRVMTWRVPAGLVSFSPGRVPRSIAEVRGTD